MTAFIIYNDFMKTNNLNSFEQSVLKGLLECGVDFEALEHQGKALGVAVSGGADSVSLLLSLCSILKYTAIPIKVITVNHFIREEKETCGDESFVVSLCKKLQQENKVFCRVSRMEKGEVASFAQNQKTGIEDAARQLRYSLFDEFIEKENLAFLCLAHNKNDQIETLLMRFLQGASLDASVGIPLVRDKYIRPLLEVSRNEIEAYLNQKNQEWRTDSTNKDTNYLRNKIRNNLVPYLNNEFEGWQTAVLSGAEKHQKDKEILMQVTEDFKAFSIKGTDEVEINREEYMKLSDGVKVRVLTKAFNELGEGGRIPYSFLMDVINSLKTKKEDFSKNYDQWEILAKKEKLFVKKSVKKQTELYFSAIIEDSNLNSWIELPFGEVMVSKSDKSDSEITINFSNSRKVTFAGTLPLRIRNAYSGDRVLDSKGSQRKIADIFSDWHVSVDKKDMIPVVEELTKKDNRIVCILGSLFGFKDWMVK